MNAWLQTYSGLCAQLLDPQAEVINILDIARALSNQCRFLGHVSTFYSVAQHSVIVSRAVPTTFSKAALLHDAAEAYLGDLISPLKRYTEIGRHYQELESSWQVVIEDRFDLPRGALEDRFIKEADLRALITEKRDVLPVLPPKKWAEWDVEPFPEKIVPVGPDRAMDLFLECWAQISESTGE